MPDEEDLVLIVEDNPQNRKLARTLLELQGLQSLEAEDAAEALALLAKHRPALVLVDVQLPGMDGLEMVRRMRQDPRTRNLPVVAMTAYAMKGDRERCLDAGCDDYLSKPIDPDRFEDIVSQYVQVARR